MPSLTYKNIPLIFDWQQAVADFMEKNQRIDDLLKFPEATSRYSWQTGPVWHKNRIGLPRYNWPDPPTVRINQLYWPCTGATRWAFGLFLADTTHKDLLVAKNCSQAGYLECYTGDDPPVGAINAATQHNVTSLLYMLTPRRLAGCTRNANELWLIPLVDQRFFWQFANVGDIASILGGSDSSCAESCTTTWETLLAYLLDKTGAPYEIDTLPYTTYCDCSEFRRPYDNLACVLDAAAASVGCQVVAVGDGTIRVERPEVAYPKLVANLTNTPNQTAGTDCYNHGHTEYARYVQVAYPILRCYHLDCDDDAYGDQCPTNASCGETGTIKTYHVPNVYADMGCDCDNETPTNLAELQALTAQMAADYDAWSRYQYDVTYASPRQWQCNGYDDHILYKYGIEEPDHYEASAAKDQQSSDSDPLLWAVLQRHDRRLHQTRVQSLPLNVGVDSQLHWLEQTVLSDDVVRFQLTGDLCRGDCAAAQVLCSVCDGDLEEEGIEIEVCDTTYRICENTFYGATGSGDCGITTACGCVPAGTKGVARFYPDACRYELVSIEICQENDRYWIEATSCIQPGESGTGDLYRRGAGGALELVCSGVTVDNRECMIFALPGELFPVEAADCDNSGGWHPSSQFGLTRPVRIFGSGDGVPCSKSTNATALKSIVSTSGSEEVCGFEETDCEITVCNTTKRIVACWVDEDHMATLDPSTCLWYLHPGERPQVATGKLGKKLCYGEPVAEVEEAIVPGWCDWNEDANLFAQNDLKLQGCEGDKVILVPYFGEEGEDCTTTRWQVVNVEEHEYEIPQDIRFTETCDLESGEPTGCALQKKPLKISIHTCQCDDTIEWKNIVLMVTMNVVVGAGDTVVTGCGCDGSSYGDGSGSIGLWLRTATICTFPPCPGQQETDSEGWTIELQSELVVTGAGDMTTDCGNSSSSGDESCSLNLRGKRICTIAGPGTCEEEDIAGWELLTESVVTYLWDDGECIQAAVSTVCVLGVCDQSVESVVCTTDCEDSSSS